MLLSTPLNSGACSCRFLPRRPIKFALITLFFSPLYMATNLRNEAFTETFKSRHLHHFSTLTAPWRELNPQRVLHARRA